MNIPTDPMGHAAPCQNAGSIQSAGSRTDPERLEARKALEAKTAELDRSLAMLRATLDSTADGILVTDSDGHITGFNQRFVQMWNVPDAVMETKAHAVLLDYVRTRLADPAQFLARVKEVYQSSPAETRDLLELADGQVFERVSRIQFVDGRSVGRVWSFRDVTERARFDELRNRLAAIVESSDDAIVSKKLDGTIMTWNQGAVRMFGYKPEEIVGKSITTLIPPDRIDEESLIISRIRIGERVEHFESVRVRKDGSLVDVSLTISPVRDAQGRIIGASKIARDITARKKADAANAHLYEETRRISIEREKLLEAERAARSAAERISVMKDEFLANVSHELRTPLNAILGWSQLISSRKLSEEDFKQGIETIQRNARAQSQLIGDLLDMSRIVSGKVRLDVQQTDLARVVEDAVASVRPSADAKEIRLRQIIDHGAGPVTGDPTRLQQVVWNLLTNAVKFTPKGGQVEVLLQRVNSHLEITVNDSGQGIKSDFLPHVFERFRQADSSTARMYGGLGLGLAIVKQLVEMHGGTVSVHSEGAGKGAAFTVCLPVAPVRQLGGKREHPGTPTHDLVSCNGVSIEGVKVLVVDDEPDARDLIRRMLEDCQARVLSAGSAQEGLEILESSSPDVILSDIGMPGIDGYEFIRTVRRLPAAKGGRTPAAALTAFARTEDRTRAMIAGYQIHVAKPIEPQELLAAVASLAVRIPGMEK